VILQNTSVLTGMEVDGQIVNVNLTSFPTNLFANVLGIIPLSEPAPQPAPAPAPAPVPIAAGPRFTG